VIMDTP